MKYTREDVIIWADDKRLEKDLMGELCYFGDSPAEALENANDDMDLSVFGYLEDDMPYPFYDNSCHSHGCVVFKKESEKKYVPFDFSKKEDRDAIKGKWFFDESCDCFDEISPSGFNIDALGVGRVCVIRQLGEGKPHIEWYTGEQFMKRFHYEDTGLSAGKEVE